MDEAGGQDEGQDLPGMRTRAQQLIGDRSASVYGVLAAGVAVLLLLLAIVWYTATGDGGGEGPVCLNIDWVDAKEAIYAGQVERLTVVTNREDAARHGPVAIRLRLIGGDCSDLPEGVQYQEQLYEIIGVAQFYNLTGEQRIGIEEEPQDVRDELLATVTPTPGPTEIPTPTTTAAPASPTAESPTMTPTPAEPTWTATVPVAPASVEAGSPVPSETPGTAVP